MKSGIYQFKNKTNGKIYIGSSVVLSRRYRHHIRLLNLGQHHCNSLQEAWKSDGEVQFEYTILEYCQENDCAMLEQKYLDSFRNNHELLYNTSMNAKSGGTAMKGKKKNPDAVRRSAEGNRGKKRTPEQIAAKRLVVGGEYSAKDPEGNIHHFKNISLFCEERGLEFRNLHAVLIGKRRSHKGWTHPESTKGARIQREVTLVAPDGTEHHVTRISKFAQENNLRDSGIYDLMSNKVKQTRGWTLKE